MFRSYNFSETKNFILRADDLDELSIFARDLEEKSRDDRAIHEKVNFHFL